MSDSAVRVNLDDLVPGMVLAEDAVHMNGRVLLCAGVCLTDKHLKIFRTWGLTEAYINAGEDGVPKKAYEHLSPELLSQSEAEMKLKFAHLDMEIDFVSELYQICVREYAEKLGGQHG